VSAPARPGRSGIRWLVAGDGPLHDEVAAQIVRTGAPVALLGRRDDVPDLMAAADVFCSTSVWEGQPLAVQEALQLGVPVVATDVGGTREVTGPAAVLVPYGDAQGLADALTHLLASPADREALSQAATAQAAHLPTAADVLTQLTATYAALLVHS
jgi:glycosyltransferase involved in cell wall biosynthesis